MFKTHVFKISFGQLDNGFWTRCPIVQNVQLTALFLGIAKWIVKRIWDDEGILTPTVLNKIQEKMKEFHVPSDLVESRVKLIAVKDLQISLQINGGPSLPPYFGTIFRPMTVKFLRIL